MRLARTGKDVCIQTNGNSNGVPKKVYVRPQVTLLNREKALAQIRARMQSGDADARDFLSVVTEPKKADRFCQ